MKLSYIRDACDIYWMIAVKLTWLAGSCRLEVVKWAPAGRFSLQFEDEGWSSRITQMQLQPEFNVPLKYELLSLMLLANSYCLYDCITKMFKSLNQVDYWRRSMLISSRLYVDLSGTLFAMLMKFLATHRISWFAAEHPNKHRLFWESASE